MINIFVIFVITHGDDLTFYSKVLRASLVAQTVKNLPAVQKTWVQSLGWEDPLEKGTATHSSMLAWRIPWTEEPSRLQSMGLQRVRHNWAFFSSLHFRNHQPTLTIINPFFFFSVEVCPILFWSKPQIHNFICKYFMVVLLLFNC